MNFELTIEVPFVGCELIVATYASFPPCVEEATAVAHELIKGCTDA